MNANELRDAQRLFKDLMESLYQIEPVFQRLYTDVSDLQDRIVKLEQQPDQSCCCATLANGTPVNLPEGTDPPTCEHLNR